MLLLSLVFPLGAQDLKIITEELPPAAYHDATGAARGWAIDIVTELERRVGEGAKIEFFPWARAYEMAKETPGVLIFTMLRTKERENLFDWVGPISRAHVVLLGRADTAARVHGLAEARLLRVGTVNQDAKEAMARQLGFENLESATNIETNYKKLAARRIDAMIASSMFWEQQVKNLGLDAGQFAEILPLSEDAISYLAFSKGTDAKIVAAWSRAFEELRSDGTMARIYATWGLSRLP